MVYNPERFNQKSTLQLNFKYIMEVVKSSRKLCILRPMFFYALNGIVTGTGQEIIWLYKCNYKFSIHPSDNRYCIAFPEGDEVTVIEYKEYTATSKPGLLLLNEVYEKYFKDAYAELFKKSSYLD